MIQDANPTLSASGSSSVYQAIMLNIAANNAQSGAQIAITLAGRGANVCWSTGPEFSTSSGIKIRSNSGDSVPLSSFGVSAQMIELLLPPGNSGTSANFTLALFLAAEPSIQEFTLTLSAGAGTTVIATPAMQMPKQLAGSPTIFDWLSD